MIDLPPRARAPLLLLGGIALLTGIAGGLVRLGVALPSPAQGIAWHGVLMASAFFGTLIALERAVAIGRLWAYLAPAGSGAGGIVVLAGALQTGFVLLALGAAVFAFASASIWWRERALHTGVLALGSLALFVANLGLATGSAVESVVPSWLAFFVLTIGGERLELSRLAPVPRAARLAFGAVAFAQFAAALAALGWLEPALRTLGVLFLATSAWLVRYDIATRTVRVPGQTRYIALSLLAGYAWLAIGALFVVVWWGRGEAGQAWDAALHSILVGYVFSMVFGHAPIILPAVLRVPLPYKPLLYAPLALLHAGLVARVAGDLVADAAWREAGALGNAAAILLFIVLAAWLVSTAPRVRR
jgi:hypothetical protein